MENKENVIEFITGQNNVCCTFTSAKYINKMNKLYQKNKENFEYFIENPDGSVCCKIPLKWVKISPPKRVSEEQKQAASERFIEMHRQNKLNHS